MENRDLIKNAIKYMLRKIKTGPNQDKEIG